MRMRAKLDSPPRTKSEPCRPSPPLRATVTPGTSSSSVSTDGAPRSAMRSESRTVALTPTVESAALVAGGGHDDVLAHGAAARRDRARSPPR
mgnify:CR=1 FL=1